MKDAVKSNIISEDAANEFFNSIKTINTEFINDLASVKKSKMKFEEFSKKYMHLRPGTYEISSNSYGNKDNQILRMILKNKVIQKKSTKLTRWNLEKKKLFKFLLKKKVINKNFHNFENLLRGSIEQREYSKFYFTKYISYILELIREIGKKKEISLEDLSHLSIKDINLLQKNKKLIKKKININRVEHSINKNFELPHFVKNVEDFLMFNVPDNLPNFVGDKKIISKKIFIKNAIPSKELMNNKIILIESADPGYDWIFSYKISGLITKFGGANSHMAIRASELNLSSAIGIGEKKFEKFINSEIIKIDPKNKFLEKVS